MKNGQQPLDVCDESSTLNQHLTELKEVLYKCEIKIPRMSDFYKFKKLFTSFVTDAIIIMDYLKENWDYCLLREINDVTENVWNVFVGGVRIQDNGHDPQFTFSQLQDWRQTFNNDIDNLELTLDDFKIKVIDNVQFKEPYEYDENSKEILSAIMNSYYLTKGY